ncbi:MAG: hypothetical protein ACP5H7_02895, partial [Minisyncoccia bacterium]
NTPFYEMFVLLSILIPFIFLFILNFVSIYVIEKIRRKLKKYYGNKWKTHIPFYLRGPLVYGSSYSNGGKFKGGFSGSFGGFGGGASGGGGATGRW